MGLYKYSQFNIEIEETSKGLLIYNTLSQKARYFDEEDKKLMLNKTDIDPLDIMQEFIDEGFVVPMEKDEAAVIINRNHYYAYNHHTMELVIGTTMKCNYHCNYCFQHENLNKSTHMNHETADTLFGFVQNELNSNPHINKVHIRWFGGETLLNTEIMNYIADKFIAANINFDGELYSNCRLLTEDKHALLQKCNIHKIDATVDGLPETYANIKGCKIEDFEETINNLRAIQDKIETVDLKINVSEENKHEAFDSAKALYKDYGLHVNVRFRPVILYDDKQMKAKYGINYDDYVALVTKLLQWQKKNGYKTSVGAYSSIKPTTCIASGIHNYVFDNQGNIYRCTHFHGNTNHRLGNVFTGLTHPDEEKMFVDNEIPKLCHKCSALPLCMSGCIVQRKIYNMQFDCQGIIEEIRQTVKINNSELVYR